MDIYNYDLVTTKYDKNKHHYDNKRNIIYCKFKIVYKYYLECSRYNPETNTYDYYLMLSRKQFNDNCFKTYLDTYGRIQIKPHNNFKKYIESITNDSRNINLEYIESTDDYDVFSVG